MPAERQEPSGAAIKFEDILSCVLPLEKPRRWAKVDWPDELPPVLTSAYEDSYGKAPDLRNRREVKQALQLVVPSALKQWVQTTDADIHYVAAALVWFQYVEPLIKEVDAPQNEDVQKWLMEPDRRAKCYYSLGLPVERFEDFSKKIDQAYRVSSYADFKSLGIQKLFDSLTRRLSATHLPSGWFSIDDLIRRPAALAQLMACVDIACDKHLPIVIQGPPASGKESLLRLLATEPAIRNRWPMGPIPFALGGEQHTAADIQSLIKAKLGQSGAAPEFAFVSNCSADAPVKTIMDALPIGSLLVVTTCHSEVAHELAPSDATIVRLEKYSFEEAEAFYRLMWNPQPDENELAQLRRVYESRRGNPLGLKLALHHVKAWGWTKTLSELSGPPLLKPAGVSDDLSRSIHLAHELLKRQKLDGYWVRLGALPQLEEYALETFAALWEVASSQASKILFVLEHDASVVDRGASPSTWRIHQQVFCYATELFKLASHTERQAAQQWLARMISLPEQLIQYREFRAQQPRLSLRAIVKTRHAVELPRQEGLLQRLVRVIRHPDTVFEWQLIQRFSRNFTSEEFGLACRLQIEERRSQRLLVGGLASALLALLLAAALVFADAFITAFAYYSLAALALLIYALTVPTMLGLRFVFIDMTHEPAWLALWRRSHPRRRAENAHVQSSEGRSLTQ